MKTEGRRQSENVEDRRGQGGGMPMGRAGVGGLGLVIIVVLALVFGVDPRQFLGEMEQQQGGTQTAPGQPYQESAEEAKRSAFIKVVLAETEDVWSAIFKNSGADYQEPKLVLFSGTVQSACGMAQSAAGPFYCPRDQNVFLDLSFYDEMVSKLGAQGDFAFAYVIAHEVGHHIQTLLGTSQKVLAKRQRVSEEAGNALSVKLELQADCYAGVWAHHTAKKDLLEQGDVEEAMNAAAAVGDDRLQKSAQGYVVPESFTHGSSAQRAQWFRTGLQSGNPNQCTTFEAGDL
jgi:predicted metalloprotease